MKLMVELNDDACGIVLQHAERGCMNVQQAVNDIIVRHQYQQEELQRLHAELVGQQYESKMLQQRREHQRWMREHNLSLLTWDNKA